MPNRESQVGDVIHWERAFTCLEGSVTALNADKDGNPQGPDFHCPGEVKVPATIHWHFPEDCTGEVANRKHAA